MRTYILLFMFFFGIAVSACRPTPKDATTKEKGENTSERGLDEGGEVTPKTKPGSEVTKRVKEETPEEEQLTFAEEEALEFQELSKSSRIKCWVGGLIIKQYPGDKMPKLSTLTEGEELEYLYQRTARKSEYTFKGQKFNDSWYLIRSGSGVIGWVHGGGIKFLPDSPESVVRTEGKNNQRVSESDSDDPSLAQQANDWVFVPGKRVGSINRKTTEDQLVKLFGPDYVKRGEVVTTGSKKEPCTYVFKDMPDEIAITWKDKTRTKIKAVYINKKGGRWHSAEGIKTGITLQDLAKLNENPVQFYGFDWDYSGTVGSWKKGKLEKFTQHFYIVLHYNTDKSSKEFLQQMKGNKTFTSSMESSRNVDIFIKRIVIYLD